MNFIIASIYKSEGTDCSNEGISSRFDRVKVILGKELPTNLETEETDLPFVYIVPGNLPGTVKAVPFPEPSSSWPMFGGCFVASCDSRFGVEVERVLGARFYGAVPLHDRYE